jgi:hypothetical protein
MNDDGWAFPPQPPAWPPAPSATPPRRTSRSLMVVALFAATGIVAAAVGVGGVLLVRHFESSQSTTGPSSANAGAAQARALYQQAVAETRASVGFHYSSVSAGVQAQTIVGDAGQSDGRQVITVTSSYGTEQFSLVLVGSTVYFQGNTPAAEDQLGIVAANAAGVAGKWVSVAATDGPYRVLQPGITTASIVAVELALTPTSSSSVITTGGIKVTRIAGDVPATATIPAGTGHLDIAPSTDLPVVFVSSISGNTFTTDFSQWGTAPTVAAPSGAVAWSTLSTSVPPSGYGSGLGGNPAPTPTPTPTPGAI